MALARGITLLESSRDQDWPLVKELLTKIKSNKNKSKRLGFSGPPGVGKSTFIEKVGLEFISRGEKVAVLAIDPSSEMTGGSILGDKTRMEELSRSSHAFVRPSPNRGHLGGVTSSLPGVILLCEAAGFETLLIESVGVGQSEVELSKMVDLFTLVAQPGAGDELQGIKKGILEYVDLIVVNKADRDQKLVNLAQQQYLAALKILRSKTVPVESCSALTGLGVKEIVSLYEKEFSHFDYQKREEFFSQWFDSLILSEFKKRVSNSESIQEQIQTLKNKINSGQSSPVEAVDQFFESFSLKK